MTQHTPGPWKLLNVPQINPRCHMKLGPLIIKSGHVDDVLHAHACINACGGIDPKAVPDLLAALEIALDDMTGATLKYGRDRAITVARAAIAKAKGDA